MNDDQKIALLRKQLMADKPEAFIVAPLQPLLRFVATSYKTVGLLNAIAVLGGESGQKIRLESERLERVLGQHLDDITG